MSTIKWIIAAAATVLIGLTLTAWLREPIENYFRNDRIEANLTVGPWIEIPSNDAGEKGAQLQSIAGSDHTAAAIRAANNIDEDFRTKPTNFSELSIENKSEKEIDNIRIRYENEQYRVVFQRDGDKKPTTIDAIDKLDLPKMKPGDKVIIRSWGNYYGGPEQFSESLSTYSSTGPFRITANWSESRDLDEGAIDRFMNDWGEFLFVGALILIGTIGFILSSLMDDKIKKILSDESTYAIEKTRYELDPKKYNALDESKANNSAP